MRRESPEDAPKAPASEEGLEPGWIAALRFAEAVTRGVGTASDEVYAALTRHWDDGQVLEITMVVGLFSYFNRFNNALCVEITR